MKLPRRNLQKAFTESLYSHADVADATATAETAADAKEEAAVTAEIAVAAVINI